MLRTVALVTRRLPLITTPTQPSLPVRSLSISSISLAMNLRDIVKTLDSIAPPTKMAEDWDNVGLLVEPSSPPPVTHVLLTNDLTEPVMAETLRLRERGKNVGLIISYHPPLFRSIKKLTQSSSKDRIIIKALESQIAIYSPHTAHDALWGGVNDWILTGFRGNGVVTPLSVKQVSDNKGLIFKVGGVRSKDELDNVLELLKINVSQECLITKEQTFDGVGVWTVRCRIGNSKLTKVVPMVTDQLKEYEVTVVSGEKVPIPGCGRLLTFSEGVSIRTLVERVKGHLGLERVRLALPDGVGQEMEVTTLAVCVGSGSSVLKGVTAQVYLTGEMSHHDILDAVSKGVTCILCEHSNTERGFLKVLKSMLEEKLDSNVEILISQIDKDPVCIV